MLGIRIVFLWHMHQPFYKDLLTGQYRLPWVRMHGLKDYYGMVKLLDEFPQVHQTFNLVPSLITQIQDYVQGTARDPFLDLAAKPAADLNDAQRRFALQYLFQANAVHLIGRYPRYNELHQLLAKHQFDIERGSRAFQEQDYTDLQVLSQLAWFDEFFLQDPDVAALVKKERSYSRDDQNFVIAKQRQILGSIIPAYATAAQRGSIEISASPFYHPIMPLLCDTDMGRVSTSGLSLPQKRFQYPQDAREQLRRGLALHEQVFGVRPRGVWPSEGSVSDDVIAIAHELGVQWMATDEGVLGRSLDRAFARNSEGVLDADSASALYNFYRYEQKDVRMNLVFRDHALSDLIGFVYSSMDPHAAAQDFIGRIKASAQPLMDSGRDVIVPVILDGENAWEYFPASGREFLRRLYQAIQDDPQLECCTMSEAISHHPQEHFAKLDHLVPGSWIHSNFNVWIGAPEDNRAWDYLSHARELYEQKAQSVSEDAQRLAFEELMIAEGSDWNWWYGPEHHSENDADFDDLYRKHLSNVYQALGETPPEYLLQPIGSGAEKPLFSEQVAYIHPRMDGRSLGYFDWLGAAHYVADRRSSAMHGKQFFLECSYAGIDEANLYCRLDFTSQAFSMESSQQARSKGDFDVTVTLEGVTSNHEPRKTLRVRAQIRNGNLAGHSVHLGDQENLNHNGKPSHAVQGFDLCYGKVLELRAPLHELGVKHGDTVRLRFGFWQGTLPVDALPLEGFLHLKVISEEEMTAQASQYWKV